MSIHAKHESQVKRENFEIEFVYSFLWKKRRKKKDEKEEEETNLSNLMYWIHLLNCPRVD